MRNHRHEYLITQTALVAVKKAAQGPTPVVTLTRGLLTPKHKPRAWEVKPWKLALQSASMGPLGIVVSQNKPHKLTVHSDTASCIKYSWTTPSSCFVVEKIYQGSKSDISESIKLPVIGSPSPIMRVHSEAKERKYLNITYYPKFHRTYTISAQHGDSRQAFHLNKIFLLRLSCTTLKSNLTTTTISRTSRISNHY